MLEVLGHSTRRFAGVLCNENTAALIDKSGLPQMLFQHMGDKKEDDEFVLQITFTFSKLLSHKTTAQRLLDETDIVYYLVDLLQDKNKEVRQQAVYVLKHLATVYDVSGSSVDGLAVHHIISALANRLPGRAPKGLAVLENDMRICEIPLDLKHRCNVPRTDAVCYAVGRFVASTGLCSHSSGELGLNNILSCVYIHPYLSESHILHVLFSQDTRQTPGLFLEATSFHTSH